jgi:hypothetical protein
MAFGQLSASFRPYVERAYAALTMFGESESRQGAVRVSLNGAAVPSGIEPLGHGTAVA